MRRWSGLLVLAAGVLAAGAGRSGPAPAPALFAYHEQPGALVPVRLVFRDADDRRVQLGELSRGVPLILIPAYYHCTSLCSVVRASLFGALRPSGLEAGRDYALAVLSIDPAETSSDARAAKDADLESFGMPGADRDWHYLTGAAPDIEAIGDAVGFRDRFDPKSRQFLHPAGIVFLTASGAVSSYLLGVGYTPQQVRAAIEQARAGRISAAASPLLLLCFHFDAATGRYSLEVLKVLRLAAVLTVLTIAGVLLLLFRNGRPAP